MLRIFDEINVDKLRVGDTREESGISANKYETNRNIDNKLDYDTGVIIKEESVKHKSCCTSLRPYVVSFVCRICNISLSFSHRKPSFINKYSEEVIRRHAILAEHDFLHRKTLYAYCLSNKFDCEHSEENKKRWDARSHFETCDTMKKARIETEKIRDTLIDDVVKHFNEIKQKDTEGIDLVYDDKIINPVIQTVFDCYCGEGKIHKCLICGVTRKAKRMNIIGDYTHGPKYTMYISILVEHFGVYRDSIKFTHEDFLRPVEYGLVSYLNEGEDKEYYPQKMYLKKEEFKCAVCNVEYNMKGLPSQEIVYSHLQKCIRPLIEKCHKEGIIAPHNIRYAEY